MGQLLLLPYFFQYACLNGLFENYNLSSLL